MKKLKLVVVLAGLLIAGSASAQTKIAYLRIDDIVSRMPEIGRDKVDMDTVGQQYVKDSILPRLNFVQAEYNRKLKDFGDTTKPAQVRSEILKSLQADKNELDQAEALIQQVQQYKQQELLQPYYAKAKKAIDAVANRKGYTHVLSTDIFITAPDADDLTLAVLAELKIPVNPPGAAKPAAKTGN